MKFDCGETWIEKKARLEKWHKFFCLWPRYVGPHDCRWLEYVERKGVYWRGTYHCFWDWDYRPIK